MNKVRTTKEKILYILKKDNDISIKELMIHFTISEVAVRRHLNDLIRQGLVQERVMKQDIGRPYHLYTLTSRGHGTFPNQYDQLPVELLKDLETVHGQEAVEEVLLKRKEREEANIIATVANVEFDEKLKKIAELQAEKGYMLEYERTEDGHYKVKNYNCPIYNLASSFKQICRNEKDMYKNIFPNSNVIVQSCMTKGEQYCCWMITNPELKR